MKALTSWTLLACSAIVLAACAKAPPRREAAVGIVAPPQWTAADYPSEPIEEAWWRGFGDAMLEDLVQEAIARNFDLRAAAHRLQAAAAQARIAGAALSPAFEASLDGARRRQNFVGFPIPGSESSILTTNSTSLGTSLNVSWEADLWGRIRNSARASLADTEVARAEWRGARHSLAAQTAKAWFAVLETRQQIELTERTLGSYQESARRIRRRYEKGLLPPLDLRLALTNVRQTRATLESRRDVLQSSKRQLEVLLGRYPDSSLETPSSLPQLPPFPPVGLPAEILGRRPDLAAAEWRLTAADQRLAEAERAFYPRINLNSGAGTSGSVVADLFDPDLFVWNLVANLTQPVFQGGRLRASADLARARLEEAAAGFGAVLLSAFAEVETTLAREKHLAQREVELSEAFEQGRAALRLAETQYQSGLQSYITVLEAQRRALVSETGLIEVRRNRLETRVDLHLALGGGFEAEAAPSPEAEPSTAKVGGK